MPPKTPKHLEDIRDAAAFVIQATAGKTLADFKADRLLRQAVERNFEIIGEAVGRLAKDDATTASRIEEHRQIISFRNLLIHGYDIVDHDKVWDVIQRDLPTLESQVADLLAEVDPHETDSL